MSEFSIAFEKERAATYDQRHERLSPIKDALHLLSQIVLEPLDQDSTVLIVGAGTGAELLHFATVFPHWKFTVLEPSQDMLDICREKVKRAGFCHRMSYLHGYLEDLDSSSRFSAATSLLVSHFLLQHELRVEFFRRIRELLLPGGLLLTADLTNCGEDQDELWSVWLRTMMHSGNTQEQMAEYKEALARGVWLMNDQEMKGLLCEAGFSSPTLFFRTVLINAWFAKV